MAREKATITLDRSKVAEARELLGSGSMSDVIDIALDRLIGAERLRRDVECYTRQPVTDDESVWAELPVEFDLDDDNVDYDSLYGSDG